METAGKRLEAAIATQVKVALVENGIGQKELAAAVGIERATLTRYLTGVRSMPMPTFFAVAEALGLTPLELMSRAQARIAEEA